MAKYNQRKTQECEEWVSLHGLMEYGGAMVKEFCAHMGIDYKTYKNWLQRDEFRVAVERGKEAFKSKLTHDLSVSLAEAAKGYEREEVVMEYRQDPQNKEKPIITGMRKKKVFYKPDVGAAIFLLTNLDPEHYQNKQRNDVTLKQVDDEREMSIDEINAEIERLSKLESRE